MFNMFTIRTRLIACMMLLGALIVIIGGVGVYGMRSSNASLQDVYTNQMASSMKLADTKNSLNRSRFNIDKGVFHPEAPDLKATLDRAEEFIQEGDKTWQEYLALPAEAEEKALTDDLKPKRAAYIDGGLRALITGLHEQNAGKVDDLAMKRLSPLYRTFNDASVKLEQFQLKAAADTYAASQKFYDRALNGFSIAILLGLAFIVAATVLLLRAIMQPLDQALHHFDEIAAGNLAEPIDTSRTDEMGALLAGLSRMQQGLSTTVQSVRTGSVAIAHASAEISSGNSDLSHRTEQQAASLEETASSLEELTATVRQNAQNAREANELVLSASSVAGKGGDLVTQVVVTMDSISASSKRIVDIIGVIDGIAFQTNILALNAAVEAARAGEQGRGFAVVASEVRNLAHRSAAAAKEIKELIAASVSQVEEGAQLVNKAGMTMGDIVDSVGKVTAIMSEIMLAGEEQSAGIDQINQAITTMDASTQQNAALVEEAAAAAESMREQAGQLEQLVSTFRLAGTPAIAANSRALMLRA
ncbi:methyl-accepting chemotaxis protein [Massilia sp. S19_KUP03_FR1]|uniref:methyl-accepting chemotaxis protein n=1 Tax=Massilia sp. S19_KUP03_FR1 TaxID=3025503 RepID=UPI002FCDC6EB